MEELLSRAIEGGAFGISLFLSYILFKRFIKKEIVEPIAELKVDNIELKKGFTQFTERVTGFVFRLTKSHNELSESVTRESLNMTKLFTEATQHTSQAKLEAHAALEKVNVTQQTADKLLKVATITHTEVVKLKNDMVMVKNKVGIKDEN